MVLLAALGRGLLVWKTSSDWHSGVLTASLWVLLHVLVVGHGLRVARHVVCGMHPTRHALRLRNAAMVFGRFGNVAGVDAILWSWWLWCIQAGLIVID